MRSRKNALAYQAPDWNTEGRDEFSEIIKSANNVSKIDLKSGTFRSPVPVKSRVLPVAIAQHTVPVLKAKPKLKVKANVVASVQEIPLKVTKRVIEDIPPPEMARPSSVNQLGISVHSKRVKPAMVAPVLATIPRAIYAKSYSVWAVLGLLSLYGVAYSLHPLPSNLQPQATLAKTMTWQSMAPLWPISFTPLLSEPPLLETEAIYAPITLQPQVETISALIEETTLPDIHSPLLAVQRPVMKRSSVQDNPQTSIDSQISQAERLWSRGRKIEAIQSLENAYVQNPHSERIFERLGARYLQQKEMNSLYYLLQNSEPFLASTTAFQFLKARVFLLEGKLEDSLKMLESIPNARVSPEVAGVLATVYQAAGNHEKALEVYSSLTQLNPTEGRWWVGAGVSLEATGEAKHALLSYREAQKYPLDNTLQAYAAARIRALSP